MRCELDSAGLGSCPEIAVKKLGSVKYGTFVDI